mmetsp:Transcript_16064/g.43774  ORF Transcript_16064/g.43774 Transcript_16064/m.43774 type:complete len:156 (+) Transcript_16064:1058-1525(+)
MSSEAASTHKHMWVPRQSSEWSIGSQFVQCMSSQNEAFNFYCPKQEKVSKYLACNSLPSVPGGNWMQPGSVICCAAVPCSLSSRLCSNPLRQARSLPVCTVHAAWLTLGAKNHGMGVCTSKMYECVCVICLLVFLCIVEATRNAFHGGGALTGQF